MIIIDKQKHDYNSNNCTTVLDETDSLHSNESVNKTIINFQPKHELIDYNLKDDEKTKSEMRKTMRSAEKKLISQLKDDMTFEEELDNKIIYSEDLKDPIHRVATPNLNSYNIVDDCD